MWTGFSSEGVPLFRLGYSERDMGHLGFPM